MVVVCLVEAEVDELQQAFDEVDEQKSRFKGKIIITALETTFHITGRYCSVFNLTLIYQNLFRVVKQPAHKRYSTHRISAHSSKLMTEKYNKSLVAIKYNQSNLYEKSKTYRYIFDVCS